MSNKKPSKKKTFDRVWSGDGWAVISGRLIPGPGRPQKAGRLFRIIGEKLPYECLKEARTYVKQYSADIEGVYFAHDSMGVARYGGRGDIFTRLASHKKRYPKELLYFSFYIIENKSHEREIETAILRAASSQMILNKRKIRTGLAIGNISDYEPGTMFLERQGVRGPKAE